VIPLSERPPSAITFILWIALILLTLGEFVFLVWLGLRRQ
jgi:hypothetical protein